MKKQKQAKIEREAHVSVEDVIRAIGIRLVMWSRVIADTDPNESYEAFALIREEMLTHSEVLSVILKCFPVLLNAARFQLPPTIGAQVIPNPLIDHKAEKDTPNMGDVPF